MTQITLHVYQSIDGCPAPSDKHFDAAVDASSCVLIDEETYPVSYTHLTTPFGNKGIVSGVQLSTQSVILFLFFPLFR